MPEHRRHRLEFGADSGVELERQGEDLVVRKEPGSAGHAAALVERLRHRGDRALTTQEIMKLTRGDDV